MEHHGPILESIENHDQLSDALVSLSKTKHREMPCASCFARFIEQYYAHASFQDISQYTLEVLFGKVFSMWEWLYERNPQDCKVRVYQPTLAKQGWESAITLIEIATRDMPFIVDSVHMALSELGYTIKFTVNIGGLGVKRQCKKIEEVFSIGHAEHGADLEAVVQMEIDQPLEAEECRLIEEKLRKVLADVQLAVSDWGNMLNEASSAVNELESQCGNASDEELSEAIAFIKWMCQEKFTFLGSYVYDIHGEYKAEELQLKSACTYGLASTWHIPTRESASSSMPKQARKLALSGRDIVLIQKTSENSTVHRPGKMDRVIIKYHDGNKVVGMRCFVGLFTSIAYHSRPKDVPILRKKVAAVLAESGFLPRSHTGKALVHILDTLPRDDLFQATVPEIDALANGILQMQNRSDTQLFVRKDAFERYYSCLVYMPNEVFNTDLLYRLQRLFSEYFETEEVTYSTQFSDSVLASIHFVVTLSETDHARKCDISYLKKQVIHLCRSWYGEFRQALVEHTRDFARAKQTFERYSYAFPSSYQEAFSPKHAARDIDFIDALDRDHDIQICFYRPEHDCTEVNLKLFSWGRTLHLSDVLPMLENLGFRVLSEQPHRIDLGRNRHVWLSHFIMVSPLCDVDLDAISSHLEETFYRTWTGQIENDAFNKLVLLTKISCKSVKVLRSYANYLRQLGFVFTQEYMAEALLEHPSIAEVLARYFNVRFDPNVTDDERVKLMEKYKKRFMKALVAVSNLDHDRIFRCFANLIESTVRTNYFQSISVGEFPDYVSFKIDCRSIIDLPLPKPLPMYDMYVRSCKHGFEGVHLRDSKVARGGIRRSDRRQDYRTEVAGLQRAQQMKNAVIVPSGAKGAFVLTDLHSGLSREAEMAAVINAYQFFIRGLLDLTDNLLDNGEIVSPDHVVCHDESDHYMVVAADKGTATFSDIANEIAKGYGYWLGDAFASGGATGYDHKRMGITARGAWKSVEHHFQQIGVDVQRQPISVAGIGDMGGDVFGNGMLMTDTIQLKAVFNHIHIFLDPNPDPKESFKERKRLFNSPNFTWADYKKSVMSKGGAVFERFAKSVTLTPEIKAMLGIEKDHCEPDTLIRSILMAEVDLIWNGGIGTYVRASTETDQDAEDATNNHTRVMAKDLRCKVFAEGGNLGLTQKARVEFALAGGIINTDFIDNSAGVDCSDHEVNIKILLNAVMADGKLNLDKRNALLADMTEEVAALVLMNNIKQNRSINLASKESLRYINLYQRYMAEQEENFGLSREVFALPTEKELMSRKSRGIGLMRPEIAVLVAHTKNCLKRYIIDSDLWQDPHLRDMVESAFPEALRKPYRRYMDSHQLSRAIISTQLSNHLVDDMGVTFIHQMQDETGASIREIVIAYAIAKQVYGMDQMMCGLEALGETLSAELRAEMMQDVIRLVRRASRWFLRNRDHHVNITEVVDQFSGNVASLFKALPKLLSKSCFDEYTISEQTLAEAKVPQAIACKIAGLWPLYSLLNIIESSKSCPFPLNTVASAYFEISNYLDLIWLRERINEFPVDDRWAVLARATVKGDLDASQRMLTTSVLQADTATKSVDKKLANWLKMHGDKVERWLQTVQVLRNTERHDFAMLTVVSQELTSLAKSCLVQNPQDS